MGRTICSHRLMTKLKTTRLKKQLATSKEPSLRSAKQKKQYLGEFYPILDNQRSHNSRTTVWTTTRTGLGVQSAWRDAPQANSTEYDEENVLCQRLALTTSS